MTKCQNCKQQFNITEDDKKFYKRISVPEPTFCPECRAQRRLAFRSGRVLYKRKVEGIKDKVFSSINPSSPFKVYKADNWWSSKVDAIKYGQDYDFNRPFFEQFRELMQKVGLGHIAVMSAVDSPYVNNVHSVKNCYLVFNAGFSENCAYSVDLLNSKDCYDNSDLAKCELCSEGFMLTGCYKTHFSSNCTDCQEVYFSSNLVNCQNCFGCSNLRHKKYHIFNKPYTKQEYFKKIKEFNIGSYKKMVSLNKKAKEFWLKYPVKFMHGRKNNNVTGENIYNSKNVFESHSVKEGEDLSYCQLVLFCPGKDCYDMAVACGELCYEIEESGGYRTKFCWFNAPKDLKNLDFGLYEIEYSVISYNSHHLFGCVGLRNKKYCILNKQYTKKEYEELVPKIKKHMDELPYIDKRKRTYKYGEFFPVELSPYAYNETLAQEYFPLTKEQAIKQGYTWYDKPEAEYKPTIKAKDLPDDIEDVNKDILKEVIECSNKDCQGTKVFRLIPNELEFYKKQNISIPRLCPDCRHNERIKQRNPIKLWSRKCQCAGYQDDNRIYQNIDTHFHKEQHCSNEFETSYAPDRKEIVYCEACYLKEIG